MRVFWPAVCLYPEMKVRIVGKISEVQINMAAEPGAPSPGNVEPCTKRHRTESIGHNGHVMGGHMLVFVSISCFLHVFVYFLCR